MKRPASVQRSGRIPHCPPCECAQSGSGTARMASVRTRSHGRKSHIRLPAARSATTIRFRRGWRRKSCRAVSQLKPPKRRTTRMKMMSARTFARDANASLFAGVRNRDLQHRAELLLQRLARGGEALIRKSLRGAEGALELLIHPVALHDRLLVEAC